MRHILYFILITIVGLVLYYFSTEGGSRVETIGIQPLGVVNPTYVEAVKKQIETSYQLKVVVNPSIPIPSSAFVNIKVPRFRADSLLDFLDFIKADSISKLIGIVEKDISFTKRNSLGSVKQPYTTYVDYGIFGLGRLPGTVCVLSTYRLRNTSEKNLLDRIRKIAVHELGHTMNLPHCPTAKCVMNDANETIKTIDRAGFDLCSDCKKKIINILVK